MKHLVLWLALAGIAPLPAVSAAAERATTPAANPADPAPSKSAKICKRLPETGTLAGSKRLCLTRAEWDRMSEDARRDWMDLQGAKGSTHGG